jgi:opacity protein-like surface antigen
MKAFLIAAAGASCLAIAACSPADVTENDSSAVNTEAEGGEGASAGGGTTAAAGSSWPKGARIVEENGVTYRVDSDGTRVALTSSDSRIVVEGDKRFRVDADGTRVRIDDDGGAIDIDVPDVDVGINDKGNPDIDVKDKNDGDSGPN